MTYHDRLIEAGARALADADYRARLALIKASHATKFPISKSGPNSGLDYLIADDQWEGALTSLKEPYLLRSRAALSAFLTILKEPSDRMLFIGGKYVFDNCEDEWPEQAGEAFTAMLSAISDEG